jgi:2-(1,2-epoxy-1,2-dihydrophenyl)acetyl-CoA isomerase
MSEAVTLESSDGVAILRLNEPDSRNALSPSIKARLEGLVPALIDDPAVRCLLLTAEGDAFCAGGDVRSFVEPQAPAGARRRLSHSHAWIARLLEAEKPVVTAVNGPAIGAGFGLALLGDIVLASDRASFLGGFPVLGVAADYALALTLPRAIGAVRAKDILMTTARSTPPRRCGWVS